jgi:polyhydroxyalkanoate synthesis repressor PhaR
VGSEARADATESRLIKRYANRKLYDTEERRFTSLSHIRVLVRHGIDVVVIDHDTGADRTEETLSQALGRRKRAEDPEAEGVGLGLLTELIRAPGRLASAISEDDRSVSEIRDLRDQVRELSKALDALLEQSEGRDAPGADGKR